MIPLLVFGIYIISNPIISEPSRNNSNYMESLQGPPIVNKMEIEGLQQNYTVGQQINASVVYTGYLQGGVEPDVEILDPYGDKVFDTCCLIHNETPTLSYRTGTFKVLEHVLVKQSLSSSSGFTEFKHPVFNSAGNYTMIASLDNKTVQRTFNVIDDTNMTYPSTGTNETEYHIYQNPPQYSIVNATVGVPVANDTVASQMAGFKVSSPTYLPPDYKTRLIMVEKDIPWVTIFASKYPLTDKTTSTQFFWLDKGILITYSVASEHALEQKNFTIFTPKANKVTIDGYDAVVGNIQKLSYHGQPYDMWAGLLMFKGNIVIDMRGFLSEDDFVKITASMLKN